MSFPAKPQLTLNSCRRMKSPLQRALSVLERRRARCSATAACPGDANHRVPSQIKRNICGAQQHICSPSHTVTALNYTNITFIQTRAAAESARGTA